MLRFRPGPIRPSLDNLVILASAGPTISMPSLARTPDLHSTVTCSDPSLKPSTNPGLQVTRLQELATTPGRPSHISNLPLYTFTNHKARPVCSGDACKYLCRFLFNEISKTRTFKIDFQTEIQSTHCPAVLTYTHVHGQMESHMHVTGFKVESMHVKEWAGIKA